MKLLDLKNAQQPAITMKFDQVELETLLYNSFLDSYRMDASCASEKIWNIKTHVLYEEAETKVMLNKPWSCIAKDENGNKKSITTTLKKALSNTALAIHGTNYWAKPIHSYYMAPGYVGPQYNREVFNYRTATALEGVDPATITETSPVADIVMQVIKNRFNEEGKGDLYAAFYCKYVCQMVLQPSLKPGTAIAFLCKDGGTGKSFLGENIPQFFLDNKETGEKHVFVTSDVSENRNFSVGYEDKLSVFFDEQDMSRSLFNKMKRNITDSRITVEHKGKNPYEIENCLRFFLSTNRLDRFNLDDSTDRRWTVLKLETPMPAFDTTNNLKDVGYDEVGLIMNYVGDRPYDDGVDMSVVRKALFKNMYDFYRAFETINGTINLSMALETDLKAELASEYQAKNPIVATALTVAVTDTEDSYNKVDLTQTAFCKRVQQELLAAHERAGKSPISAIKRALLESKMFKVWERGKKPKMIYLTALGVKMIEDEESLYAYQRNVERFDKKLHASCTNHLPDEIRKVAPELTDGIPTTADGNVDFVEIHEKSYKYKEFSQCQKQYLN